MVPQTTTRTFFPRLRTLAGLIAIGGLLVLWPAVEWAADKKPNNKNDEAEIQAAQKKVEEARGKEGQARKAWQEAQQRTDQAQKELLESRNKVEARADSPEVRKLRGRVVDLHAEIEQRSKPILAALAETPAQQTLLAERDAARVELADQTAPALREAAAAQLAAATARVSNAERAALDQDEQIRRLRERLEPLGKELQALTSASRGALDKDEAYQAAKRKFAALKEREEAAEVALARARQAVLAAQRKVQAEVAEERAEDRREQMQKQNKKNDNKKKK